MKRILLLFSAISLNCIAGEPAHQHNEVSHMKLLTDEDIDRKISELLESARTNKESQLHGIMPNKVSATITETSQPHDDKPTPSKQNLSNKEIKRSITALIDEKKLTEEQGVVTMATLTKNALRKKNNGKAKL